MAQWTRIDLDQAPQGHGLARAWGEHEFVAFERNDGQWMVQRFDDGEPGSAPVLVDNFTSVRAHVDEAIHAYDGARAPNPYVPGMYEIGMKAVVGTIAGLLLGGLPGVLLGSSPLTIVGVQAGGIAGGVTGAALAAQEERRAKARKKNPDTSVAALKAKLLKR